MEIVYHFGTASDAVRACQNEDVASGSVLVVPSDCIIGLAGNPPRAITDTSGPFEPFAGSTRSAILAESEHSAQQIQTAVDEAYRHGFPVSEALGDFATLRSQMPTCAREYRLTNDEILALVDACESRTGFFHRALSRGPADSEAGIVLQTGIANLSSARRKLLDRPL